MTKTDVACICLEVAIACAWPFVMTFGIIAICSLDYMENRRRQKNEREETI